MKRLRYILFILLSLILIILTVDALIGFEFLDSFSLPDTLSSIAEVDVEKFK